MSRKILIVLTAVFFAGMLFLTAFAEKIHESTLPSVTLSRPERKFFEEQYIDINGEIAIGAAEKIAVPKEHAESGIYVWYTAEKNGTKRDFVKLANVVTGEETADGYVEIVSGLMSVDRIVIQSDKPLYDGCEVRVLK